jgi:hypothetical protein
MKGIMAGESSTCDQGVPSFAYSPADASLPLLFSLKQPLSKLKQDLLREFAGRQVTFRQTYKEHSVDTPYVERNYREALQEREIKGHIEARSSKGRRRAGTFPEHVVIEFPNGEGGGYKFSD